MINEQKSSLRSFFRKQRAAISDDTRNGRTQAIWGNIFMRLPEFHSARTLLLYFPLPQEINLIPVFNYARQRGINCAFPRCGEKAGEMEFYITDDLNGLSPGKYGIREPLPSARQVTDFHGALIFVPALAFDREGYRLGYGGGYYDRFLAAHSVPSVGIAYEDFIVDSLPRDKYDCAVDYVVTEKGIHGGACGRGRSLF